MSKWVLQYQSVASAIALQQRNMKTIPYAIAAAGAVSVAEATSKMEWTKKELEDSTHAFFEQNEDRIKSVGSRNLRKLKLSPSATWQRELRGGKGKKKSGGWSGSSGWSHSEDMDWSGSGWSQSGKAGKRGNDSDGHNTEEKFFILPASCPGKCITSDVDDEYQFAEAVKKCKHDDSHMWSVLSDGSYLMVESYDRPHWCIAVDYKDGDDEDTVEEACKGEYFLALKECGSYGTQWYFTGGNLINSMCWAAGLSSFMGVYLDDDDKQCEGYVSVYADPEEPILRADTFMFVNHLPESPVELGVDDS